MPSLSQAQARLMAAARHNPKFARKVGVPHSVAVEFNNADKENGMASQGGLVGSHDGSSEAMARGGSALSHASMVTARSDEDCGNG